VTNTWIIVTWNIILGYSRCALYRHHFRYLLPTLLQQRCG
jgi:hypothetical protein